MANAPAPLSPVGEIDYIRKRATELGLDPEAVLAVATHEGLTVPAQVGDSGTSFGPWQLHAGGRLPPQIFSQGSVYAQQWANSTVGIDYALQGIATVAKGKQGPDAVTAIVNLFERPRADLRAGEVASSISTYNQGGAPLTGDYNPASAADWGSTTFGNLPSAAAHAAANVPIGGVLSINDIIGIPKAAWDALTFPEKMFAFLTSWRFAEIVGGIILLVVGLFLVGRALGVSVPVGPLGSAASSAADNAPGPISQQPRRVKRQAGFTLPVDRKPARGSPGSAMLAEGDSLPY